MEIKIGRRTNGERKKRTGKEKNERKGKQETNGRETTYHSDNNSGRSGCGLSTELSKIRSHSLTLEISRSEYVVA